MSHEVMKEKRSENLFQLAAESGRRCDLSGMISKMYQFVYMSFRLGFNVALPTSGGVFSGLRAPCYLCQSSVAPRS